MSKLIPNQGKTGVNAVADPDIELRGGPGYVLLALLVLPSVIVLLFFFYPKRDALDLPRKRWTKNGILHICECFCKL